MKSITLGAAILALSFSMISADVQAKRLGGGGLRRPAPTQPAPQSVPTQNTAAPAPTTPSQQAAPQPAAPGAAAAPAAAPKRSWLGPVAGLAAGLGLAALASHLGFGGALANLMTMLLIGVVLMLVVSFVMRRFAASRAQGQLAPAGASPGTSPGPMAFERVEPAAPATAAAVGAAGGVAGATVAASAAGFDAAGFEQIAKRVFIRMQAANDSGDQNDLRRFTTPEMYASIQQELLDRKGEQRTDVVQLQAQVIERAEEAGQQIVSVRFSGLIREHSEAGAEAFDEVWHLQRPLDESREWAIAGIQPAA